MKFSEDTITVLKNFASIYDALALRKGNVLRTWDTGKVIMVEAGIQDEIPQDIFIGDLNSFLSVLSIDENPSIEFDNKHVYIVGNKGRSKITYRQCAEESVKVPPTKNFSLPTEDIKFDLSEDDFKWIMRSATILQNPHIGVIGDGSHVYLKTMNAHDDSAHSDSLDLGEFPTPQNSVRFLFKTQNWKMIPGAYTVTVSSKGLASFDHKNRKLHYWVAIEANK